MTYQRTNHKNLHVRAYKEEGTTTTPSCPLGALKDCVGALMRPRVALLLVPAGKVVDGVIDELSLQLRQGDLIMDGGNSQGRRTLLFVLENCALVLAWSKEIRAEISGPG